MKSKYRKDIKLETDQIMQKLFESSAFIKNRYESLEGQMYSRSPSNMMHLTTIDKDEVVFSESAGMGGASEVTARCKLRKLNNNHTTIELSFKCGAYYLIMYPIFLVLITIVGIILTYKDSGYALILLLSLYPIIMMISTKVSIKKFLWVIAGELGEENSWY